MLNTGLQRNLRADAEQQAARLATLACHCLIDEARLTPKPGLVDQRGSGAHQDLTLALMERSAHSLNATFYRLVLAGWQRPVDVALRQQVGAIGRQGEQQMMQATGGVNTHRGAIWALGLLCTAAGMAAGEATAAQLVDGAARLAQLPDANAPQRFSNGQRASQRYRLPGAREEAQQGFPHVMQQALPQLLASRRAGATEDQAQLNALMAMMVTLSDTCVLSRAGAAGLQQMQQGAANVLAAGGTQTAAGRRALAALDASMLACNASPGGAADLLAATLFIDRVTPRVGEGNAL